MMGATTKAAIVGIQKGDDDYEEMPGTILITDDGVSGRVYFQREDFSMAVDLGDLMDAIKTQLGGGNK
jgi:hypothetical protein